MGRWRPPAPKSSPYITPEGFAALQKELQGIWVHRRDVVKALAEAAAEGDRSENAEYIYRKKELGGLDRRIRYLQKRLPDLNVVRESPGGDSIYFDFPNSLLTLTSLIDYKVESKGDSFSAKAKLDLGQLYIEKFKSFVENQCHQKGIADYVEFTDSQLGFLEA